jgi:hypothetical protein
MDVGEAAAAAAASAEAHPVAAAAGAGEEVALEVSSSFGTVSEYFFCALRGLRFSAVAGFQRLGQLDQQAGRVYQELKRARATADEAVVIEQLESELDKLTARRLCFEAHLCDREFSRDAMRLYLLTLAWLLRLVAEGQGAAAGPPTAADGADAPPGALGALLLPSLPLPKAVPRVFAAQPEHLMVGAGWGWVLCAVCCALCVPWLAACSGCACCLTG